MVRQLGWMLLCGTFAGAAQAGQACHEEPLMAHEVQQGMALAEATASALQGSGAEVVVLARAGQDLSRFGQRWSHLGFAYRHTGAEGRSSWLVLHKLNHCGTAEGQLYRQGLGQFFMDRPYRYQAAYVVPNADVQAALKAVLANEQATVRWHTSSYSMVAYPWAQAYQQSNQWLLETLAGALHAGAADRPRAQAWLQLEGYQPAVLRLGAFTRLGARVSRANVAFDDHPNSKRFADRIETVTADSVFDWLQRSGRSGPVRVVR